MNKIDPYPVNLANPVKEFSDCNYSATYFGFAEFVLQEAELAIANCKSSIANSSFLEAVLATEPHRITRKGTMSVRCSLKNRKHSACFRVFLWQIFS